MEAVATSCNILANGSILHAMWQRADAPVPRTALSFQVAANTAWVCYAVSQRDPYLGGTALMSLGMQCLSLALRVRHVWYGLLRHERVQETKQPDPVF